MVSYYVGFHITLLIDSMIVALLNICKYCSSFVYDSSPGLTTVVFVPITVLKVEPIIENEKLGNAIIIDLIRKPMIHIAYS